MESSALPVPRPTPTPVRKNNGSGEALLALALGFFVFFIDAPRVADVAWDALGLTGGYAVGGEYKDALWPMVGLVVIPLFFLCGLAARFVRFYNEEKSGSRKACLSAAADRLGSRVFSGPALWLPALAFLAFLGLAALQSMN